jgi:CBS domain-containing protein
VASVHLHGPAPLDQRRQRQGEAFVLDPELPPDLGRHGTDGAGGRVDGILSERDIIRALADHGAAALEMPAAAIMTRDVITCAETDTIDQVMSTMTAGRFRHLPVVSDDGLLVGRELGACAVGLVGATPATEVA